MSENKLLLQKLSKTDALQLIWISCLQDKSRKLLVDFSTNIKYEFSVHQNYFWNEKTNKRWRSHLNKRKSSLAQNSRPKSKKFHWFIEKLLIQEAIKMLELDPYNANDYHNMADEFIDDSKLEVVLQEKVKVIS